ncbi:MAG: hypothetical protein ACTSYX_02055 [Candidatus Thorarchaeota archaeon]
MAETVSTLKSIFTQTTPQGERYEPVDRIAGLGGLFGVIAALLGVVTFILPDSLPAGTALELPFQAVQYLQDYPLSCYTTAAFLGLLAVGMLLQARASKKLGFLLESGYPSIMWFAAIVIFYAAYLVIGGASIDPNVIVLIRAYVSDMALAGWLVVVLWQLTVVMYTDASKSYVGLVAGLCNGFFWPVLALSGASSTFYGAAIIGAYALLMIGQVATMMFWWMPKEHIREFARSTDTAKFAFGISGFLTFLLGSVAVFDGAIQMLHGVPVWMPWSSYETYPHHIYVTAMDFYTPPWVVQAFILGLIFWLMLAPRLGSSDVSDIPIHEDILKGGLKWFTVFLGIVGVISTTYASTLMASMGETLAVFISIAPAAAMFLVGTAYAGANDVIVGLPLVFTSVFLMVTPYSMVDYVTIPWIIIIITQALLMVETKIRGHTMFAQTFLTVIATGVASLAFIAFLLGSFGRGPPAMWPANVWFPVHLFPDIPVEVQAPTIMTIVVMTLIIRNVSVVGYSTGAPGGTAKIIGNITLVFAFMVVMFAGAKDITHQALTAASVVFMLYTISFVLVLSLNLNLGSRILKQGHELEGNLIRVAAAAGLVFGALVALYTLYIFSGFPSPIQIAGVITFLITLVVGLEILSLITWLSAGIRLGMLTGGFKFKR